MSGAGATLEASGDVCGATCHGLDLRRPLDPEVVAAVRAAVLEHVVVCFPHQELEVEDLEALTEALGGAGDTPFVRSIDGHPGVVRVVKEAHEVKTVNFGGAWHTDWSFQPAPPAFTMLWAVEVPPSGGNTMWADQRAAWDALPAGRRAELATLDAVHSAGFAYAADGILSKFADGRTMVIDSSDEALAEQVHPLAPVHPETGRQVLFVNPTYTTRIVGRTVEESKELLGELYAHSVEERFVHEHVWSVGDLVIWDDRSTQHNARNDYDGHRRELLRMTVGGSRPGR